MKKIILVLAALAVTSVAAFAGPAISVGGGFGGDIEQKPATGVLLVSPVISLKADFQWEKFGVAADFDFNLVGNNPWKGDGSTINREEIYVNPYANFNLGDFNFNIGPLLGLRFEQDKAEDYADLIATTSLFFGGSLNCNYKITEKLNAYLEVPVIANNMDLGKKQDSVSIQDGVFYYQANLEVIPKFGVTYTF